MGVLKIKVGGNWVDYPSGPQGPIGPGVAVGGTPYQVLVKNSTTNYDTGWAVNPPVFASKAALDAAWVSPPDGAHAYTTTEKMDWIRISGSWVRSPGPWVDFVPPWWGSTANPTIGNGILKGKYRLHGDYCDIWIYQLGGSTTNGGLGSLYFGVPFTAHSDMNEQVFTCKTYLAQANLNYMGFAYIAGNQNICYPHFPYSNTAVNMAAWAGTNSAGSPGTGVPQVSGGYSVHNGQNFTLYGSYRIA